ncbi:MAG: cytochrome c3 family protein [Deltaproteobacteria bacterium]|nr:cytochrome c3 family protein [Deltaproteobacteria bacterium]
MTGVRTGHRLPTSAFLPAAFLLAVSLAAAPSFGESIVSSKHNLSVSGPGTVKAGVETQVCVFCHTPHRGSSEAPLWNRYSSGAVYIPYFSTTAKSRPGQPTGASKLCLSCHDGTVALGLVRSASAPIEMQGGVTVLPSGASLLGTDLGDDHPVSFTYDSSLASSNGQLRPPSSLTGPVRLDENLQMQCTSCHDAHDNRYGDFLAAGNYASALCTTCHDKRYWTSSIHRTAAGGHGNSTWNGVPPDPWPHTEETTVPGNGCENCHSPHTAGSKPRLLNFAGEEQNCFPCHNGNVAVHNVQAEFNKLSTHPVGGAPGVHDPTEDLVNPPRHVTCVDCHNPHAARVNGCEDCHVMSGVKPVVATGLLAGVKGVSASGTPVDPVTYQYELCFRCHGDSVNRGAARVPRQFVQTNTRLDFASSNASFHPVTAVGRSANVPSLMAPYTTASMINCTECHNNSQGAQVGGSGPVGPHGSAYVPLLERRQELTDYQAESSSVYALCYKCHNRDIVLSTASFRGHRQHVMGGQFSRAACTTCHDPHGVASVPRMINFNANYVTPSSSGQLRVDFTARNCYLTCHGRDHNPSSIF